MKLTNVAAVVSNTFTEILRQPIYGIVIAATILCLIFAPMLTMLTLSDDDKLLIDVGLSTLLVSGLFVAAFAASYAVTEEIERKTTLTVLSKAISRPTFILGKFLGITAAVLLAQFILSLCLFIIVRHGVLERASDEIDKVAIFLGGGAIALACTISLLGNYFYSWRFSTAAIALGALFITLAFLVMLFIDPHWQFNPAKNNIKTELIAPLLLNLIACLVLAAIALAASTRMNQILTLIVCVLFFLLGSMLPYWLGPVAQNPTSYVDHLAWVPLALVPNINFYMVSNAIYTQSPVPLGYVGQTGLYALFYIIASLLIAIALFRSREVG